MVSQSTTVLTDKEANQVFSGPDRRCKDGKSLPWDEWFDGQARVLSLKLHFPTFKSLHSVRSYISLMASRRKIKVRCRQRKATQEIVVQAQVQDAPSTDLEKEGKPPRRSVRDSASSTKRGQQQSRPKAG